MKASVPKLFFCPGSASYTPVTQGSRWRGASRQLRKPTTPSALAFFVVVRAPSGFPFGCAVQNPITPLTPTLPTRPPLPKNTGPQTLLPPGNGSLLPNPKAFQTRKIRAQPAASARPRHFTGGKRRTTEARDADAGAGAGTGAGAGAIQRLDHGCSGRSKAFQRRKRLWFRLAKAIQQRSKAFQTHGRAQSRGKENGCWGRSSGNSEGGPRKLEPVQGISEAETARASGSQAFTKGAGLPVARQVRCGTSAFQSRKGTKAEGKAARRIGEAGDKNRKSTSVSSRSAANTGKSTAPRSVPTGMPPGWRCSNA